MCWVCELKVVGMDNIIENCVYVYDYSTHYIEASFLFSLFPSIHYYMINGFYIVTSQNPYFCTTNLCKNSSSVIFVS